MPSSSKSSIGIVYFKRVTEIVVLNSLLDYETQTAMSLKSERRCLLH